MTGFLMLGLQILILLNPFAVLSTFLSLTPDYTREERRQVVFRSTVTVILSSVLLYFSGGVIFSLFGINMDVFRIGGGVILMVCAVSLVAGKSGGSGGGGCGGECRGGIGENGCRKNAPGEGEKEERRKESASCEECSGGDIAVVPTAIPMAVGPGTSAGIIVIGMEKAAAWETVLHLGAILSASLFLCLLLLAGTQAERFLGKRGISIITKLTGLFLSAIGAGMILEGIRNFFHLQL